MPEVKFHPAPSEYEAEAAKVGVLSMRDEDIRSLKQLIIYGVKGAAAYAEHALNLGHEDPSLYEMLENALAEVSSEIALTDDYHAGAALCTRFEVSYLILGKSTVAVGHKRAHCGHDDTVLDFAFTDAQRKYVFQKMRVKRC